MDYFSWAPHLDIISIDLFPPHATPASYTAITYDLMCSLKQGRPFLVMEQTPSQVNWMAQNPHKRPGNLRLQSHQAIARGADGVMYFQWRQICFFTRANLAYKARGHETPIHQVEWLPMPPS